MTAPTPDPQHEQEWPGLPESSGPIQDPVPQEMAPGSLAPYEDPASEQVEPYQTFAAVRRGVSGIKLAIKRPNANGGIAGLRVQIDDRLIPADDGDAFVTLPPGRHTVSIERIGAKDTKTVTVDVPPGRAVAVHYAMPFWIGASPVLSLEPVETPGKRSFVVFLVAMIVGVLLICAVAFAIASLDVF